MGNQPAPGALPTGIMAERQKREFNQPNPPTGIMGNQPGPPTERIAER